MDDSRLAFLRKRGLARIRQLRVVVVGAGGSGSHIVQQLAHLGVRDIVSIDPDALQRPNVNRVVMSHWGLVGRPKAAILSSQLKNLGTRIKPLVAPIESPEAIAELQEADICFGAVDHFGTRHMIEYFARMAFVPVIDVGMQITPSRDATQSAAPVLSAGGQIVTSLPGGACFWCMGFLTDELLTRERARYADGDPVYEQQVISVNGLLASQAVTNMLALFARFAGPAGLTRYISYNVLAQTVGPHPNLLGLDLKSCSHYPPEGAGWFTR